ncbi:hypothetical protein [Luteimonas qiangzhengi]
MPDQHLKLKRAFEANGLSIAHWADKNGFRKANVYSVLSGRTKGRRGEAHRIALALGLKQRSDEDKATLIEIGAAPPT